MIPKIFHYCWFGKNPKDKLAERCMRSWKKYCPDYQFIEWNEENFDIASAPRYVREAYQYKKYAFIGDYVRLKAIYEQGGVYFDLDAELIQGIDDLLDNEAFFGAEAVNLLNLGHGFGAAPHNEFIRIMLEAYKDLRFYIPEENRLNLVASPHLQTASVLPYLGGIKRFDKVFNIGGNLFLTREYFCPMDFSTQALMYKTANTRAIHWFAASWYEDSKLKMVKHRRKLLIFHRFIINTFGMAFFTKLKNSILYIIRLVPGCSRYKK